MSLRLRLVLVLAPLFALGLAIAGTGTYLALNSFLVTRVDQQLASAQGSLSQMLLTGGGPGGSGPGGPPGPGGLAVGTEAELVSSSGQVMTSIELTEGSFVTTPTSHPVLPSPLPGSGYLTVSGTGDVSHYRIEIGAPRTLAHQGGDSDQTLVIAMPLTDVDQTSSQLLTLELAVGLAVLVVTTALTALVVGRGLHPLERMGQTARSIAASDLSRRVTPATERTEVGRLGLALNTMLEQLEGNFTELAANEQRMRHFLSDASHELRTPLTSMRGYAELLERNPGMDTQDTATAVRRLQQETARMSDLVDDLMLLARLDQGRPLEMETVDLSQVVEDAVADARAAALDRSITVNVPPLSLTVDPKRLHQALSNLLRNASVHTPPATSIEVVAERLGTSVSIEVSDHGPGIPSAQRERIFSRFHRVNPETSGDQGGSGLGLSIVAAVVAAHEGSVDVLETPGGGATFRMVLPLERRDATGTSTRAIT